MELPTDEVTNLAPRVVEGDVLTLVEGITTPRPEKQPGGKANRRRVRAHIVEIDTAQLAISHPTISVSQLRVKPFLVGHERLSRRRVVLDIMETSVVRAPENQAFTELLADPPPEPERLKIEFRALVVRHTSHNNGGKLFFRFVLFCNTSPATIIDYVDSQDFQTITQRGLEKRRDREPPVADFPESESHLPGHSQNLNTAHTDAFIEGVEPAAGIISGHQFVKLIGHDLPQRLNGVVVRFGTQDCFEVLVVKRNFILCETPAVDEPGHYDIRVSFDGGQTFLPSFATYQFVDPTSADGRRTLMLEGFRGIPSQVARTLAASPTTITTPSTTHNESEIPNLFSGFAPPPDDFCSWLLG